MDKRIILMSLVVIISLLAVVFYFQANINEGTPFPQIKVDPVHQQCQADEDCMNIYTDHSACYCAIINKAFQEEYKEKLASLKDSGLRCDYDCKITNDVPSCDKGICKLKIRGT